MVSRPVVDGITGFRHRAASRWNGAAKDTPNPPAITTPMPTPAGVTKSGPVAAARLGGDGRAHRRPARRVPERGGWGGQPCDELAGRLGRVDLTGPPGLGGEPRMALNTRGVVRSGYPLPVRPGAVRGDDQGSILPPLSPRRVARWLQGVKPRRRRSVPFPRVQSAIEPGSDGRKNAVYAASLRIAAVTGPAAPGPSQSARARNVGHPETF